MSLRQPWLRRALLPIGLLCIACGATTGSAPLTSPKPVPAMVQSNAVSPASGAPFTAEPAPAPVRLAGQASTLSDAGLYLAEARGYFREQGIELDRQVIPVAAEALPQLVTGRLDALALSPSAGMLNALGRGIPLKIVADKGREGPGFAFQSVLLRHELLDNGSVRTAADLRGRRVALPQLGTPLEASLAAGLAQGGLSIDDVQIELLTFPDMVPALANAGVDAA